MAILGPVCAFTQELERALTRRGIVAILVDPARLRRIRGAAATVWVDPTLRRPLVRLPAVRPEGQDDEGRPTPTVSRLVYGSWDAARLTSTVLSAIRPECGPDESGVRRLGARMVSATISVPGDYDALQEALAIASA